MTNQDYRNLAAGSSWKPGEREALEAAAVETCNRAETEVVELACGLYEHYRGATGGRSAITGAPLPEFAACPSTVRAGWITAATFAIARGAG